MDLKLQRREIQFPNDGITACAIDIVRSTPQNSILEALNITSSPKAIIPISGGAKFLSNFGFTRIYSFVDAVVELAFENNIMLVDGGTKTGVMEIIGKHYGEIRSQQDKDGQWPPLIGFIPFPLVKLPWEEHIEGDVLLEPNHPYFIFVHDAFDWGDEAESMIELVNTVSLAMNNIPSISLIVNGGLTTLKEAVLNIHNEREIIVLDGGYRATKLIIAALDGANCNELEKILMDKNENLIREDNLNPQMALKTALDQLDEIASYKKISTFRHDQKPNDLKALLSMKLGLEYPSR